MKSRRSWSDKEDEAFAKLTQEYEPKNWAIIAKRLALEFGFKRRSGKQCRERWYNHLVPGISKKVWSKAEEDKLLQLHKTYGNKWTVIAEHMPGRTDNSIKNYFYSTVRRSLRRMGKLIGSKNSTSLLRAIKPSTLTHIFSVLSEQKIEPLHHEALKQEFETLQNLRASCEDVRDQIVQFSSYKPKRTDEVDEEEKKRYDRVFQIILKLNDIYERIKGFQKNSKSQEEIFREGFKQMMKEASEDDSSGQHPQSSASEENQDLLNPHLITTRTTRTRKIKVPEKLISTLPFEPANPLDLKEKEKESAGPTIHFKDEKDFEEEKNFEPQLKIVINSPEFGHLIEEDEYSNPHFQIELKDQVSNFQGINTNFNAFQKSPNFYFGTPADKVNYFKSPLAYSCLPNVFAGAAKQELREQIQRDLNEVQKVQHKNVEQ